MVKDISILVVGIEDKLITSDKMEVEYIDTLENAINHIKTKFYDVVIVNFKLPDGEGARITNFYPHYRTIILLGADEDVKSLAKFRNGFFAVVENLDNINTSIDGIIAKYPKKEQDTLLALMGIQGSISELNKSQEFIKNSFTTIHNRLKSLEDSQNLLNNNFNNFKKQRTRNEQFFIETVVNLKEDIDELRKPGGSKKTAESSMD